MIRARRVRRAGRRSPGHGGRCAAGLAGQFDVPCAVGEFVEEHGECSRYEAGCEIVQPNVRSHSPCAYEPGQEPLPRGKETSTRRFFFRPSSLALLAIGYCSP